MPTTKSLVEMASQKKGEEEEHLDSDGQFGNVLCSYLGLSFAVFLGLLPRNSVSLLSNLQTKNKALSYKLMEAEEELRQLHCRRKEDSKANARVVEIFASHRHAWQQEEKRLIQQIDECNEEIEFLKGKVEEFERVESEMKGNIDDLKREISDKDEILKFMTKNEVDNSGEECYTEIGYSKAGVSSGFEYDSLEEIASVYGHTNCGFSPSEYLHHPPSKFWSEKATPWQDMQFESQYQMRHFVPRRESPWKADSEESNGITSKLKLLEQELIDLEAICNGNLSKFPSQLRKQAKRYQTLSCKLDELCHRMQDPCEASLLSSEFRAQRQTEFLVEAFRLQQNASETGQKLMALQTEMGKSIQVEENIEDRLGKLAVRRGIVSISNNLKEIQRNMEIWLARIIGDVEGILARDSASRGRDYYVSRYPFAQ